MSPSAPISFAGSKLTETRHFCVFYDKDRMLLAFEHIASGNAPGGFPLSRIVCRMDWSAEGQSPIDDLIEFESRVNHVWERRDDAVICPYHFGKFGDDTVIDIMPPLL